MCRQRMVKQSAQVAEGMRKQKNKERMFIGFWGLKKYWQNEQSIAGRRSQRVREMMLQWAVQAKLAKIGDRYK